MTMTLSRNDGMLEPALLPPDGEQAKVHAYFDGAASGFFVDVGANAPCEGSQSYLLEHAGWHGILIEPQPALAAALRKARSAAVFAVACSSPAEAGRTMPLHVAGGFSSLDPKLAVAGIHIDAVIDVPVRTLDDILAEAGAPQPIDLLSIDVEGHEIEVLRGLDLARWCPRLILLEDHVVNLDKHRFLDRAGYRLVRRTGLNAWYVPHDDARLAPSWFGRWQIFRKYYLSLPFTKLREAKRRLQAQMRGAS